MDRYTKQRMRMVDTQIHARGVKDVHLLKVMETIPRHLFVEQAMIDGPMMIILSPIGEKQTIRSPISWL